MKQFIYILILLCGINSFAQDIIAKKGSFGIDKEHNIIVWHEKNLDSVIKANSKISNVVFGESFIVNDAVKPLSYSNAISISNGENYVLYISKIPLVHIKVDTSRINSNKKIPGYFSYFNTGQHIESVMGVRHRGNLSLSFAKKSFDLEFWTDSILKQKKDIKFNGMRKDDDWILDAMYNEPLRLRSYVSTKLWSKIHKPYYAAKEPKAKSGFDVKFVEVFKNDKYYGVYQLSESVDRKQLKLKKNVGNTIHGELFKANSYNGGPDFTKSPAQYKNIFPHWNGWKTEYPFIDYTSDFSGLSKFTSFVVNGTDEEFSKSIENEVYIANVIDYYLFVNTVRATDNLGKNYYLGKYDSGEPYVIIPWDLDGVMGIIQDGKRETVMTTIFGNGLFDRLLELNVNGYRNKVKNRWITLRASAFSNEALLSRVDKIYTKFTKNKVYEREQLVWKNKLNELSNDNHYQYLYNWIIERLAVLDAHFKSL